LLPGELTLEAICNTQPNPDYGPYFAFTNFRQIAPTIRPDSFRQAANHTGVRATLDHPGDHSALAVIELGGPAPAPCRSEDRQAPSIEPKNPVSDDLETNTADLRSFRPRRAILDRSKRQ
jgi:hypothetical protein